MNARARRKAKREGVRKNPKKVGRPEKVGVERGKGPRHADNAKEGEEVPSTDTVPAMLTPREAVLNRNAAEMAGRGNIEALNAKGNQLAEEGVDLAGGRNMDSKQKLAEGGTVGGYPAKAKNPFSGGDTGGAPRPMPSGGWDSLLAGRPNFTADQWYNPARGAWQARREGGPDALGGVPPGGPQPMPLAQPYPAVGDAGQAMPGGFYPPGQGIFNRPLGAQEGVAEVPFLGSPEKAYGPPVTLSAPEILSKLQQAAKEQGLSAGQIAGIAKAFSGLGGGGAPYDQLGGAGASFNISGGGNPTVAGYAGGISDIGYPPFIMPRGVYHADKGGWQGAFDPLYTIPVY